jgi:hypothetical protein
MKMMHTETGAGPFNDRSDTNSVLEVVMHKVLDVIGAKNQVVTCSSCAKSRRAPGR